MDRLQPAVRQGRAADGVTGDAARVSSDRLDWRGGMAGGEQRWAGGEPWVRGKLWPAAGRGRAVASGTVGAS